MTHVTVGWGRDYADVAPVRGVVFGSPATQELSVAVEVTRDRRLSRRRRALRSAHGEASPRARSIALTVAASRRPSRTASWSPSMPHPTVRQPEHRRLDLRQGQAHAATAARPRPGHRAAAPRRPEGFGRVRRDHAGTRRSTSSPTRVGQRGRDARLVVGRAVPVQLVGRQPRSLRPVATGVGALRRGAHRHHDLRGRRRRGMGSHVRLDGVGRSRRTSSSAS